MNSDSSDFRVAQLVDDFHARRISTATPTGLSLEEGMAFQERYVGELGKRLGPVVGYKAGLVSVASQQRYATNAPVRGVLLHGMLIPSGTEIPAAFGGRASYEADFIVVVKDEGIHSARTHLELLQHLSEVVAFIECPDPLTSPDLAPTAAMLAAINVAARLGVMGQRLPVIPTQQFADALANQDFILTDETGKELVRAKGTAMLGHPLNVAAWMVQDLNAAGVKLKAGDLLSLGTVSPSVPTKAGQTIHQRCDGLPGGTIGASVRFI